MAKRNLFYLLFGATTGGGSSEALPLNITPTTEEQNFQAAQGGYSPVKVAPVTASIDANIKPTNIRAGVTVLGVEGNLEPDKPDQTKTVTPSTEEQRVVGDTGYELGEVIVKATPLQVKTVAPTTTQQTVSPDTPNIGLSKITVEAIELEQLVINPTTSQQVKTPSAGKDGFSQVTIGAIELNQLTVSPSEKQQVINPPAEADGFGTVTVQPIETEANPSFTANGTFSPATGKYWKGATVNVPQSVPEPVATDTEMDAKLVAENEGKAYLFTGTTGKYTQGNIYVVEASA